MTNKQQYPPEVWEAVRRVVDSVNPDRVILFGSIANGTDRGDSDIDLLVVKDVADRRQVTQVIYQHLIGVGKAVDVIVVTSEDVRRFGNSPALVIYPALRDGKVLYDRQTTAA